MMIKKFFIVCLVVGVVTGCGRKSIPVSSVTDTTTKKDSITQSNTATVDSIYHSIELIEKKLPGATVGVTLTKAALDSLIAALGTLPQSSTRTLYYQDPKLRAQLQILLTKQDSIEFRCTALEQTYYEKYVKELHYRESLTAELTRVNTEKQKLQTQVRELKQTPWQKIKAAGNNLLLKILLAFLAIGIVVALADWIKRKLKALIKINPFTR